MDILRSVYRFFTSYALATTVLVLLTLITLLGTLAQIHLGLWGAVTKYFHEGWFVFCDIFQHIETPSEGLNKMLDNLVIPLPGGLLLMYILFINMVLGAVVYVRKRVRGIPNLVTHIGILFLFVSAYVTFKQKNDGFVALFPGQKSNTAKSYKEWQLEIYEFDGENKPTKAHIIPWKQLLAVGKGKQEFFSKNLPFSVELDHFMRNASPIPESAPMAAKAGRRTINQFKLLEAKKDNREERNFPGCFATILVGEEKKKASEMILSAYSSSLITGESPRVAGFEVDGKQYGLLLAKVSWPIDYYIKLDKFIFEKHPGTDNPRNYESRITRLDSPDDSGKKVAIRMNEPMRHGGFVVFQESYGQDPQTGEYYSQFAVSDNPSDQWPTYALVVMGIGLACHFVWRLIEYLKKSTRKKSAPAVNA